MKSLHLVTRQTRSYSVCLWISLVSFLYLSYRGNIQKQLSEQRQNVHLSIASTFSNIYSVTKNWGESKAIHCTVSTYLLVRESQLHHSKRTIKELDTKLCSLFFHDSAVYSSQQLVQQEIGDKISQKSKNQACRNLRFGNLRAELHR